MFLRDFYCNIARSEASCARFLRVHGVLPDAGDEAPCDRCGGIMRQTQRRDRGGALRPTMRCTNNQCRTHRSIRRQKDFSIMLMLLADLVADYQCFKYWNW